VSEDKGLQDTRSGWVPPSRMIAVLGTVGWSAARKSVPVILEAPAENFQLVDSYS